MAYSDQSIKKDFDSKPIPQYWNPDSGASGDYEPAEGSDGAPKVQVEDGKDAATGATTDATVAAGAAGSVSAKLRRLTADLDSVKTALRRTSSFVAGTKTVGTTEVELYAEASRLANRIRIRIFCEGDDAIYIIPTGGSTSDGYPVPPGTERVFELDPATNVAIYGIAASNQTARIIEEA